MRVPCALKVVLGYWALGKIHIYPTKDTWYLFDEISSMHPTSHIQGVRKVAHGYVSLYKVMGWVDLDYTRMYLPREEQRVWWGVVMKYTHIKYEFHLHMSLQLDLYWGVVMRYTHTKYECHINMYLELCLYWGVVMRCTHIKYEFHMHMYLQLYLC